MLAGYLPFDDDPANPEGDNINLLYKYIVNTPLTFPEYVTPHARDLLRRILVPSPRKRADLFEVARHSWLSEYAHVVELITSTTTTSSEIQNTTVPAEDLDSAGLARSASVREPSKAKAPAAAVGDLARKQGKVDSEEGAHSKQQKDNKRRTVQVEYVAPTTQTQRGEPSDSQASPRGKTRARSSSQGPVEVQASPNEKALPRETPSSRDGYTGSPNQRKPPSSHRNQNVPPARTTSSRTTSDNTYMTTVSGSAVPRPATGGSVQSMAGSRAAGAGARASYGQPLPPAVVDTNALGSIQQPKGSAKNYVISNPIPQETPDMDFGRPSISVPSKFAQVSGFSQGQKQQSGDSKGHRRSNTIGEIGGKIFGRSGSLFGGRKKRPDQQQAKESRKYPPVSMSNTMPGDSRTSMESRASRRSFSLGLGKKRSGSVAGSQTSDKPKSRRFSLIRAMGLGKDQPPSPTGDMSQQDLPIQDPPDVDEYGRYVEQPGNHGNAAQQYPEGMYDEPQESPRLRTAPQSSHSQRAPQQERHGYNAKPTPIPSYLQQGAVLNSGSESSIDQPQRRPPNSAPYQSGYDSDQYDPRRYEAQGQGRVLHKNKRFTDAYDEHEYGRPHDHAGSSGAAKRVMDFFRRRGRARGGEA